MARPLVLNLDGEIISVSISKIDRDDLYGSVEIEAFDDKGKPAELMVLAADGRTLINKGGTALAMLDEKGNSVSRDALKVLDIKGDPVEEFPSSFDQENKLEAATVDDYLAQIVKSAYLITPFEDGSLGTLSGHIKDGGIYRFPFSFRGGTDHDNAFILGNGGDDVFMIIGRQAVLRFAKLNQSGVLESVEEEEISGDDLDFDLL